MASNPPAQCCTIGVKHEGEATGEIKTVGGYETYISYPKDKSTKKAILILTDVMGHKFINAQLIADQFAANGYFVAMPDLFFGKTVPINPGPDFNFGAWLSSAPKPETTDAIVTSLVSSLRDEYGAGTIGGVGYCWGAKYVVRFLQPGKLDAGYIAHPSFIEAKELRDVRAPLSIAAAETDSIFPPDKRRVTEEVLAEIAKERENVAWQINLFGGVEHGFAVRADLSKRKIKWAKEQAFYQAVQWFDQYLEKA